MPSLYSKYHDNFLNKFKETGKANLINNERILFGKHKNGYIFPFRVLLKPVTHALKEGIEFVANI